MTLRLTKKLIDELRQSPPPKGKQLEVTDSETKGLRVIVTGAGNAYYWARFHHRHRRYSELLGSVDDLSLSGARTAAQAYRLAVVSGSAFVPLPSQRVRFGQFLTDRYLPEAEKTNKASSVKADRSKVRNHLIPYLGNRWLDDIAERDIRDYLDWLQNAKKLSLSTCDRHLALLQAAFKYAIRLSLLKESPTENLKMFRPRNAKLRYLSTEEVGRFVQVCWATPDEEPFQAFLLTLALGLRISETLAVRFRDWDLNANLLYLPDSKTGARYLPLNDLAVQVLKRQSEKHGGQGLVFRGKIEGKPMSRPFKAWQRLMKACNIDDPEVTPHTLRHSYASHLLMNGVDMLSVSKLLGHSSTHCVQQFYGHLSLQSLANASSVAATVMTNASKEAKCENQPDSARYRVGC